MFALYFPFMLIVQLVLLNLLIAIMTASHHRIGSNAAMVAQYQRARLIVDLEPASRRPSRARTDLMSSAGPNDLMT